MSEECAENIRIQYGGSANAKNAPELSACPDVGLAKIKVFAFRDTSNLLRKSAKHFTFDFG